MPQTQLLEGVWKSHLLGLGSPQSVSTVARRSMQLHSATGLRPRILAMRFHAGLPSSSQVYLGPIMTVLWVIKHTDLTNPESSSFFLRENKAASRLKSQKGNSVVIRGPGQANLRFLLCKGIRGILTCVRISVANIRNPIQNGLSQRGFISSRSKRKDAREELTGSKKLCRNSGFRN